MGRLVIDDEEQAVAVLYTNRHPWGDFSILQNLTPERLAAILNDVKQGECPAEYLELAQDIELKDLHYRSVLSTRKDAITGLDVKVIPAGEDKVSTGIAAAVERDIVKNTNAKLYALIRDMLDALAKGFSVNEIIWDTSKTPWKPAQYKFRDPRWFQYDRETGKILMLRAPLGIELEPLRPCQFIVHEPRLISGNQITAGLALPALYYWMLKNYDVSSWAAFIDRFGYPIRVGKYGKKMTEQDRATLKRAVAAIGQDFGAVIPESAQLDIIEAKTTGETSGVYEAMASWVDKQISKLVLGQTASADETPGKLGGESEHEQIRQDIADSDIQQVVETLNSALTIPYVKLNFGEQEAYPKIDLFKPDKDNTDQIITALEKLGPLGLKVKADEVRAKLGVSNPEEGDEVIGGRPEMPAPEPDQSEARADGEAPAMNAEETTVPAGDDIDDIIEEPSSGYVQVSDEIAEVIEKAADSATDFKSFKAELEKLVKSWPADKIAECIAVASFKARALGDADFDREA
jgi:phage gp29-like protein